jgi:NhaA family Na+:H+ antiporter
VGVRASHVRLDRFLLLPVGAVIAMLWANLAPESYFTMSQAVRFVVNDVLMALFFGLLAQEAYEAVMPGGALHTWRRWATPIVAAVGGTVVAPLVFLAYVNFEYETMLAQAWPVACAIDIVASYYVLHAIRARRGVIAFTMIMALVANAITLAIIVPGQPIASWWPAGLVFIAASIMLAGWMRRRRVAAFWPYLTACGVASWIGFYLTGLQPALALMPIVLFLPHEPRQLEDFPDTPDDDETHHTEHEWHQVVQVVLFLFGLVNAGVLLRGYDTGTWALMAAALVGRPVGVLVAVAAGSVAGLHLPRRVGWRDLVVVAFAASSGFTLALFVAADTIAPGPILSQITIGALSIVIGAALAFAAAALLHVGRFARRHPAPA